MAWVQYELDYKMTSEERLELLLALELEFGLR